MHFAYTAAMSPLSPKKRSELRARAHKLDPTVIIGDKGLTDEVLAEVERSLAAHELIKVRAATDDRDARNVWLETICERLGAHPVQQIGKVLVVYREKVEERQARGEGRGARGEKEDKGSSRAPSLAPRPSATRTSRPRSRTPSPRPESGPRRRRPRTSR